jgi:cobalamin biosynthesis Mg chelatase CobN
VKSKILLVFLFVSLLVTVFAVLPGCNTSRVQRNKHVTKTDSNGTTSVTVANVSDSAGTTVSETTNSTETEIDISYSGEQDTTTTTVVIGGDTIKTTGKKPVSIKVKGKVQTNKKDSTAAVTKDSTSGSSTQTVNLDKTETSIEKNKTKQKVPMMLFVVIGIAAVVCIGLFWMFGPPRKRKK